MTIKEYNMIYYPKISQVHVFLHALENAMRKTEDFDNAMMQLECIGWSDELKETIQLALDAYKKSLYAEFEKPDPEIEVVGYEHEEFRFQGVTK